MNLDKKQLTIIGIIVAIAFLIYWFFFRKKDTKKESSYLQYGDIADETSFDPNVMIFANENSYDPNVMIFANENSYNPDVLIVGDDMNKYTGATSSNYRGEKPKSPKPVSPTNPTDNAGLFSTQANKNVMIAFGSELGYTAYDLIK